jgi:hypothetical protein
MSRSRTRGSASRSSASTDPRIVASGVRSWWAASVDETAGAFLGLLGPGERVLEAVEHAVVGDGQPAELGVRIVGLETFAEA